VEGAVTSPTAAPVLTELYGAPTAASAAMSHPVLWHFTFSHFVEKVRWALDRGTSTEVAA